MSVGKLIRLWRESLSPCVRRRAHQFVRVRSGSDAPPPSPLVPTDSQSSPALMSGGFVLRPISQCGREHKNLRFPRIARLATWPPSGRWAYRKYRRIRSRLSNCSIGRAGGYYSRFSEKETKTVRKPHCDGILRIEYPLRQQHERLDEINEWRARILRRRQNGPNSMERSDAEWLRESEA